MRQPPPEQRPPVSVVLATHSRPEFLSDCVASVARAMSERDELLVMECCNPDAARVLSNLGVRATLVSGSHAGKCAKLNAGIRRAQGDIVLVTDDDCRVPPDWVDAMVAPFANAVVGAAFGPSVGLSSAPGGSAPVLSPGPAPPELWNFAHGLSMAVRRNAAFDVGGFDERLGPGAKVHGEEADIVLRLASRGWTCVISGGAPVQHLEWRNAEESLANLSVYQRGAGAYLGAGLRRDLRTTFKPFVLRVAHELGYWRNRSTHGSGFAPRMTLAFAAGLADGVALAPRRFLSPPPAEPAADGRTRVLWVTDEPPDRHQGGGNIRQAMLLDALSDRVAVTLLLAGELQDESTRGQVEAVLEVPPPRRRRSASLLRRRIRDVWRVLVQRRPSEVVDAARVRRVLRPVLARLANDHDVVLVQHLSLAPLLPKRRHVAWVLHLFDVTSERTRQELAGEAGRRQRWLLCHEAANSRRYEREAIARYDRVVVVSEADASALGVKQADIVANGVQPWAAEPPPPPPESRILLPATLDYRPNVLGALWFCDEVLPLVQARVPAVRFALVGRRPVGEVVTLARRPGVELHADVARMTPWLTWTRIVVVPLQIGTGTRLKALEAMAAGRPVVGTTIGLEGLNVSDGVQARVVDDPVAMAAVLVELLSSDSAAASLATAGRLHVEARFGWPTIGETLAKTLVHAANPRPGGATEHLLKRR